jgi:hypothetical protein
LGLSETENGTWMTRRILPDEWEGGKPAKRGLSINDWAHRHVFA